ncbi:penicillin-binding protein activator [Aliivibrio sp. S4TY2]|uniref:penicillin-binding protein activator n=1 Tax=unclassified Aliivibrio TaxID=2645654 RepID=UPI002378F245|nr:MULTISPECIES: penicillin-binding protein activator [unclassified Aliivibrio]MDD9155889.1 penicillin-binding protein activator [Aliivibrio sp. S4TY2]MDD9159431.1 penicillin-binding protein activator [Aliivibrio sp. S4TY1]MDD9163597.1 penicillin-binding protein activator [Aliivibrio sp. S4MY2]MDD9167598.1 penicillin-binding protein activator [Aliivibrio sp. S4MY4]MDD9186122.1 penicillin-binding protein activator [Aliivibrio sp. S4MY3]
MANMTLRKNSVTRLIAPVALALTLAACSSSPKAPERLDITQAPVETSSAYILKADQQQGTLQADFLIMALKASVQEQNFALATNLLTRLKGLQLSPTQTAEMQLNHAKMLKSQNKFDEALQVLNFEAWWQIEDSQWVEYYQLRYELHLFNGDNLNAARELISLNAYTPEDQKQQLWSQVWTSISSLNSANLQSIQLDESETNLHGWVQLVTYLDTLKHSPARLQEALNEWLQANPTHPAATYTPQEVLDILALEIIRPDNVALLLPLSGRFGPQAIRVRDGFINGMMEDKERGEFTKFKVIDTGSTSMEEIMATLTQEDIQFVVGPLLRSKIEEFQSLNETNIAQLALNIPTEVNPEENSCYFTLSPEQEAEQAAIHLFEQGHKHPLFLAPQGTMGERLSQAFSDKWYQLTAKKPSISYFGKKSQLQQKVNSVFGIESSQARIYQMNALAKMELESQPRSRRDIDAVYMVAKSSELVLLKPFIDVAINPGITPPKLYASSRSNSGRQTKLVEIKGIEFSDIPLLIKEDHKFKAQYDELWPKSSNGETRLHALGMDAYQLIAELPQMKAVDNYHMQGKTGELSINQQCVIQREMSWAIHGEETE